MSSASRSLDTRLPASRPVRWVLAALAVLALMALMAGFMVYLLDRPAGSAWLLPAHWQAASAAGWFGSAGAWLPSLAHGFAFSLLTALVLPLQPRHAAFACTAWAVIETLAEIGQHRAVSGWLASAIESTFGGVPWAAQVGRYFSRGVFDPADVLAGLAGCGLAWLALHAVVLRHRQSMPGEVRACEDIRRARAGGSKRANLGANRSDTSWYREDLQRRVARFGPHERAWRISSQALSPGSPPSGVGRTVL